MNDVIDAYKENGLEVEKIINKNNWITILAKVKNN
jgi:ribosomal protein L11 methylase PrmA